VTENPQRVLRFLWIIMLQLAAREAELLKALAAVGSEVEQLERGAHGVLRCDPPEATGASGTITRDALRERASNRVAEWASILGAGRVTVSAPLVLPPTSAGELTSACTCRREAWVVQMLTPARRIQVVAACLSALPPDGRRRQLLDATWLDEVGGSDGPKQGLARLTAFYAAIAPPLETYEPEALGAEMATLELPPADYVHLRTQRLLAPNVGACVALERCLACLGAEVSAWAALGQPLAPLNDGMLGTFQLVRSSQPPQGTSGRARADLVVRFWERLEVYLGSAILGHAELGTRSWLAAADAHLRRDDAEEHTASATTPLELLLSIAQHPSADVTRRARVAQLLAWLSRAPPPVGAAFVAATERLNEERTQAAVQAPQPQGREVSPSNVLDV
jgi:hypothetical protein